MLLSLKRLAVNSRVSYIVAKIIIIGENLYYETENSRLTKRCDKLVANEIEAGEGFKLKSESKLQSNPFILF